ncbi:E3 ubiquitin-protein ligase UPL1 [Senna tora]|uniref:HECT-type E3 ubiquitin transferase n=1 Tax=Senna tora TaxID=362788 RepID=A0A834XFD2_9FABA|nr:E3 ubiquitin-protein ligase UPL1 [Senna tora]
MQVGKALFDGQLLDVYFTRSFYKHILGVKVTYHDIEAVDPDYYKNLKWMLEVPLDGFKALQGISGPQRFQIHKAYGAPDRLPSAHTW